jgi:hypothetical protein
MSWSFLEHLQRNAPVFVRLWEEGEESDTTVVGWFLSHCTFVLLDHPETGSAVESALDSVPVELLSLMLARLKEERRADGRWWWYVTDGVCGPSHIERRLAEPKEENAILRFKACLENYLNRRRA